MTFVVYFAKRETQSKDHIPYIAILIKCDVYWLTIYINMAESSSSPGSGNNRDSTAVKKSSGSVIPSELTRSVHLTRISNRKSQVKGLSRTKKLEKLTSYSMCKVCIIDGTRYHGTVDVYVYYSKWKQ